MNTTGSELSALLRAQLFSIMDRPTISWAESSPEDAAQMVAPSGTENCGSPCVASSSDSESEVHAVAYDKSISGKKLHFTTN